MTSRHAGAALVLCALVACLALAMNGCGDDHNPVNTEEGGPPIYPTLSHPQSVLEALELAYTRRDSTKYKDLYDSTYTGESVDLNDPGSNTIHLEFEDEARHIAAVASIPGLSAYVDLGPPDTWDRLPSDDLTHPDWSVVQIVGSSFRVEIRDANGETYDAIGEAGTLQEFAFAPTPDSTSPTDTLWRIVRWREIGRSSPDP